MKFEVWIEGRDGSTRVVEVAASSEKAALASAKVDLEDGEFVRGVVRPEGWRS